MAYASNDEIDGADNLVPEVFQIGYVLLQRPSGEGRQLQRLQVYFAPLDLERWVQASERFEFIFHNEWNYQALVQCP